MSLLKDATTAEKNHVENVMKSLWSLLLNLDKNEATAYAEWFVYEVNENNKENELSANARALKKETDVEKQDKIKKRINSLKPKSYPNKLVPGDVVHIQYGVRTAPEINGEHYGVFLKAKGSMCLIAPITSKNQPDGKNVKHLSKIGLPNENANGSYINFGQMAFISYRRLEKIKGVKDGKLNVSAEIQDIWNKFINIVGIEIENETSESETV